MDVGGVRGMIQLMFCYTIYVLTWNPYVLIIFALHNEDELGDVTPFLSMNWCVSEDENRRNFEILKCFALG